MNDEEQQVPSNLLKDLLPYFVFTALMGAALSLAIVFLAKGVQNDSIDGNQFVVFDVVKLVNAQKAVASVLLKEDTGSKAEGTTLLLEVSKGTKSAIEKVANGRAVLVKQGVVSSQFEDITDEVLDELKLPKNVPTTANKESWTSDAPVFTTPMQQKVPRPIDFPTKADGLVP